MRSFALFVFLFPFSAFGDFRVQVKKTNGFEEILSVQQIPESERNLRKLSERRTLRHLPYFIGTSGDLEKVMFEEYEVPLQLASPRVIQFFKNRNLDLELDLSKQSNAEVRTLVSGGPLHNRIHLTILGDGYTLAEKDKFFQDAEKATQGLFEGRTFATYLPLFNVHAVFVPSRTSGIGDGSPQDTAFRLYRTPKGSKRAIMPGNESALEQAIRLAPRTDYPLVIANDAFYGGLGGRYAISTSSERSGLIVLRHELGHNFGEVGEEYDNGMVYRGANASRSTQVPWKHWLDGTLEVHEARVLSGDYIWSNLKNSAYKANFNIPQMFQLLFFELSSVGWDTPEDVMMTLNGKQIPLAGKFHEDRSFFSLGPEAVQPGSAYKLRIEEKIADENNVLGFAVAFAAPLNYNFTPDKIGAFATYDGNGNKSYRPTHKSCLMRDMETDKFCSVDIENMWNKFFARVKLIDDLQVKTENESEKSVRVSTQELEGLQIRWFLVQNGKETELTHLQNALEWKVPVAEKARVRVRVQYRTPEVRFYKSAFDDEREIQL